jgi:hypothetical protein
VGLIFDYNPAPKPVKKENEKPDFKTKRTYKKKRKPKVNKNIEMFHDRIVPHWKKRGAFSKETRNDILRIWGECCFICGNPNYSIHHVREKGFGIGGRGVKRNGIPLCIVHHTDSPTGVHHDRALYEKITDMFIKRWGQHFYKDKYDLWMENLIENPTDELYEKFMREEEEHAKDQLCRVVTVATESNS